MSGCSLAVYAPSSLPSAILSLFAIAIVPRHSKARTMLTRRSFRCSNNGLALFFLAIGTTTMLLVARFRATLEPDGRYSVEFQAVFLYFLERSWLDLRGSDFTFVIRTTGHSESGCEHRAFWRIFQVSVYVKGRESGNLNDSTFGCCGGKWLVFYSMENNFFCSLFFDKPVRDFTFFWLCLYPKYSAFDLSVRPVANFSNGTCRSFLTMC